MLENRFFAISIYLCRGSVNKIVISQQASRPGAFKQCRRRRGVRDWPLYHKSALTRRGNWLGDRGPAAAAVRLDCLSA